MTDCPSGKAYSTLPTALPDVTVLLTASPRQHSEMPSMDAGQLVLDEQAVVQRERPERVAPDKKLGSKVHAGRGQAPRPGQKDLQVPTPT